MQNSKAYDCLIKQLNANGSEKMDGYYPKVMEEIYDWEREEVEDIIWDAFFNKNEIELAQFFPKLKKYDGIKALKESPYLLQIPSEASVEIGKILYEATGDDGYLDIIKKNIDASPETISFVSILSYCKPCQRLYNILVDIYINNSNKVNRSTAVMGILYNKGIIKDRSSIKESNDVISLRKKFKSEDSIEREKILEKFEAVCAMFALDLIGVKVFGYSDETAEAVASGEKLLKESETIYESFADMMSPEDAKRYLDFLENGSREGLTSAELAGVEKTDALLVSRKVEYEDVWDLRNAGDVLESGSKGGLDTIIKNGKVSIDDIKTNPSAFSGKSAEEIADVLRNSGYDVTIKNSTRSRSGAQIIQINNSGGGKNISQVQVSPGGGRHGSNPYVKISTTDQGIIKIVDGIEGTYKTDGKETATIIFSGGN